jgi:hypothetical protein
LRTVPAAGLPDPTEHIATMPPLEELDAWFGEGAARYVRRRILDRVIYSPEALRRRMDGAARSCAPRRRARSRLWRAARGLFVPGIRSRHRPSPPA